MPQHLKPEAPDSLPAKTPSADVDGSLLALVTNWRLVVAELAERGIDLYDPAVLARPWPGVRAVIFSLIDSPTRLRAVLTRR
ncbi:MULTISPECIES: hypothetical protein [Cryobacterium]|uniref:hypothetical protein n=1 Tax=Cryobacterium TaxID=69578 RepID=UPI000CD3F92D|nr:MULTISPECIES: hypothetical protein [Cryobacterium]POH63635.1 hypothetical protein C3B60_16100 [Cryobacterium zongtaii]TFC45576.1 hypothetical protein E3O57_07985 [Cryobacterium sp. TMN-39-2]